MKDTASKEAIIIGDLVEKVMKHLKTQAFQSANQKKERRSASETPIFYIGMNNLPDFPHAA